MDTEYAFTTITAIEAYYEYYEVSMPLVVHFRQLENRSFNYKIINEIRNNFEPKPW